VLKVHGDITAPDASSAGERLMLISNDARLRSRLGMLLPNWGFRVSMVETTQEALDRLRTGASKGSPWSYTVVLADLTGMRSTALSLRRNLERQAVFGNVRLVCLYGDDDVPEELRRNTTLLSRQAPDPDLRQALLARPAAGASEHIAVPQRTGDAAASIRNARVLLVEDNPVNLMVGQRLLGVLGVNCDTAGNGEAALMRMSASRYDLVLMDCQMPVLDGYAATRQWRENEAAGGPARRLPIVAMTANAMAGDRQKCLDAGMDDYLAKPVTRAELERCLHRWCTPRSAPANEANAAPANRHVRGAGAPALMAAMPPAPTPISPAASAKPPAMAPTSFPEASAMPTPGLDTPADAALDVAVLDELREVLGSDVRALIDVFLDDAPQLIADLETAASRPDYPLLYQAAHSLKSSSANLGAMSLSAAAKRIELGARAEALDRPAVAVTLLAGEFERARDALRAYLHGAFA